MDCLDLDIVYIFIKPLKSMNTNRLNRDDYELKVLSTSSEMDKEGCFRYLTSGDRHIPLCHGFYTDKHINTIIELSNYLLVYTEKADINKIVAFSLVEVKKHMLDILLLCALPNDKQFGKMMAYSVYQFAVEKKCRRIYTAPRTDELRATFMRYGFERFRGVKGIDEVLVKEIVLQKFTRANHTLRSKTIKLRQSKQLDIM
jgi:hypothetical protein